MRGLPHGGRTVIVVRVNVVIVDVHARQQRAPGRITAFNISFC